MNATTVPALSAALPEIGRQIDTGGFVTNYHDVGSGDATLLIHGSGPGVTAWANWRVTLPALARFGRAIAPDMLGFGYTQSPPSIRYGTPTWLAQIASLLDRLEVRKVNIIGNSFGGALALRMAREMPERTGKLVLMGPVGTSFPLTDGLDRVWGYEPSLAAMRELLDVFVWDRSIITDDLVDLRYRASTRADVQDRFARLFPAPRQRWIDMLAQDDAALRRIECETLIVHGRDDRVIPYAASEKLVRLLPRATLVPIERCGHWVQIEHPEEFLRHVTAFLYGGGNA
jgi:pimeloyl-ACP methyl ester carboxylesterase